MRSRLRTTRANRHDESRCTIGLRRPPPRPSKPPQPAPPRSAASSLCPDSARQARQLPKIRPCFPTACKGGARGLCLEHRRSPIDGRVCAASLEGRIAMPTEIADSPIVTALSVTTRVYERSLPDVHEMDDHGNPVLQPRETVWDVDVFDPTRRRLSPLLLRRHGIGCAQHRGKCLQRPHFRRAPAYPVRLHGGSHGTAPACDDAYPVRCVPRYRPRLPALLA